GPSAFSRRQDVWEALRPLPEDLHISAQSLYRLAYWSYEVERKPSLRFRWAAQLISSGPSIRMCCRTVHIRTGITAECPLRHTTCSLSEGLCHSGHYRIRLARSSCRRAASVDKSI